MATEDGQKVGMSQNNVDQALLTLFGSLSASLNSIKDMEIKWLDRYSIITIPVIAYLL